METTRTRCAVSSWGEEHQLSAIDLIRKGEVVVAENPLIAVRATGCKYGSYAWELTERILTNNELYERFNALRLKVTNFNMDFDDQKIEQHLVRTTGYSAETVRRIYFGVGTNNVAYSRKSGSIAGYGIYPIISRANHSCRPNSRYQPGNHKTKETVLQALSDIRAGEAITFDYVAQSAFARADYILRNLTLMANFGFVCRCERCDQEMPDPLRNMQDLSAFFTAMINGESSFSLVATK